MHQVVRLSVAIVAIGFLPGRPRFATSRITPPDTRRFVYSSKKGGRGGETVTRNGDVIRGDMFIEANHAHYEGRIAADGTIPRLDIRAWRSAAEAKHPRVISAIVDRDSAKLIEHLGSHVDTLRFQSQPGVVPVINPSMGLMEVVVARARSQKSPSAKIPILLIDALSLDTPGKAKVLARIDTLDVTFLTADTVRLGNGPSTDQMRVIIGADGRVRGGMNGSTAEDTFSMRATSKPAPSRK
jgi:hypothetical protein